jgi:hypothetical protein
MSKMVSGYICTNLRKCGNSSLRSTAAHGRLCTCHINEVAESDGQDFIVIQFIEGPSLREWLRRFPLRAAKVTKGSLISTVTIERSHQSLST